MYIPVQALCTPAYACLSLWIVHSLSFICVCSSCPSHHKCPPPTTLSQSLPPPNYSSGCLHSLHRIYVFPFIFSVDVKFTKALKPQTLILSCKWWGKGQCWSIVPRARDHFSQRRGEGLKNTGIPGYKCPEAAHKQIGMTLSLMLVCSLSLPRDKCIKLTTWPMCWLSFSMHWHLPHSHTLVWLHFSI
jgi:hypothetical protein